MSKSPHGRAVLLDTTSIAQHYPLRSLAWRRFVASIVIDGQSTVLVPQVVLWEANNKVERALSNVRDAIENLVSSVERTIGIRPQLEASLGSSIESIGGYPRLLNQVMYAMQAMIVAHRATSHDEVLARLISGRPPFREDSRDGKGYRDFLIWGSIRTAIRVGYRECVLVSGNKKDFRQEEICEWLDSQGLSSAGLIVVQDLEDVPFDPAVVRDSEMAVKMGDEGIRSLGDMMEDSSVVRACGIDDSVLADSRMAYLRPVGSAAAYLLSVKGDKRSWHGEQCYLGVWPYAFEIVVDPRFLEHVPRAGFTVTNFWYQGIEAAMVRGVAVVSEEFAFSAPGRIGTAYQTAPSSYAAAHVSEVP